MSIKQEPIDAVLTWVDGHDPKHEQKLLQYIEDKTLIKTEDVKTRYNQVNEIEFAVKSILKFAPFVRNIFIVTDNQTPDFLKKTNQFPSVKIISHLEIFKGYEAFLPTFNSRPIETLIYKIPDLSEHFIYLNDDYFFIKECKREDFFKNGLPVLRGSWKLIDEFYWFGRLKLKYKKKPSSHKAAQQKGAKLIGFKKFYKFYHTPAPLRKSTFSNYFKDNPEIEKKNVSFRFRNLEQFTMQSLINHIEIKNKTCVLKSSKKLVFIQNYNKSFDKIKSILKRANNSNNKKFLCLQGLDRCPKEKLDYIISWLKVTIG